MSRKESSSAEKDVRQEEKDNAGQTKQDPLTNTASNPEPDTAVDQDTAKESGTEKQNLEQREAQAIEDRKPEQKHENNPSGEHPKEAFPLNAGQQPAPAQEPEKPGKEPEKPSAEDGKPAEQPKDAFPLKPEQTGEKPQPAQDAALKNQSEAAASEQSGSAKKPEEATRVIADIPRPSQEGRQPAPEIKAGGADDAKTQVIPAIQQPAELQAQPDQDGDGKQKKKLSAKTKKILAIVGGSLALLIAIVVVILILFSGKIEEQLNVDTFYDGIFIEDVDLSGKTMEEAEAMMSDLELRSRDTIDLTLQYGDQSFHYTEDDFSFVYNTEEVLNEAYQIGREGNIWLRYFKVLSLKNNPEVLTLNHELDQTDNILSQIAADVAEQLDTEPRDASVKEFNPSAGSTVEEMFVLEDGVVGIEVDQTQLVEDCRAVLESEERSGTVEIQVTETPFEMDQEALLASLQEIASYSTNSTNTANGNHNMANALNRINGTMLQPGETFSFNGVVGRRTAANGFREAGVISNGVLVDGLGGGVCQASTTVYGAAIRAGMEVVERGNHRWPSSYVPIGQDAMVSWGSQDMKFKNSLENPIYIKSYMSGTTLHVIIYGTQPEDWDTIEISSWKTSTLYPGEPTRKNDSSLPKGTTKVEVAERYGSTASAQRTYYKDGKKVKTEDLPSSRYNPVTEVILVGTAEPDEPTTPAAEEQPEEVVEE